jgi:hypothetical protein
MVMTKSYFLKILGSNLKGSCRTYQFFFIHKTLEHLIAQFYAKPFWAQNDKPYEVQWGDSRI